MWLKNLARATPGSEWHGIVDKLLTFAFSILVSGDFGVSVALAARDALTGFETHGQYFVGGGDIANGLILASFIHQQPRTDTESSDRNSD